MSNMIQGNYITRDMEGNIIIFENKPTLQGPYWIDMEAIDEDDRIIVKEGGSKDIQTVQLNSIYCLEIDKLRSVYHDPNELIPETKPCWDKLFTLGFLTCFISFCYLLYIIYT